MFQINEAEIHLEMARVYLQYIQGDRGAKGPFNDSNIVCLTRNQADT
jgi:hypothetical protein